jgi:hypothetical protein
MGRGGWIFIYKSADLGLRFLKYELLGVSPLDSSHLQKLQSYPVLQRLDGSELHHRAAPAWKLCAICKCLAGWLGQRLLLKSSLKSLAALFSITDGRPSNQRCFEDKEGPRRGPGPLFLADIAVGKSPPVLPQFFPFFSSFSTPRRRPIFSTVSEANVIPTESTWIPCQTSPSRINGAERLSFPAC